MKVRLREVILDQMLVLAAVAAIVVAAGQALHLAGFDFVVAAVSAALLVCASFFWDLRRGTYKKLGGLGRAIMLLIFATCVVSVLSVRYSSAAARPLLHKLNYFALAVLIALTVIEGIRQNREKQALRSVKENGTV